MNDDTYITEEEKEIVLRFINDMSEANLSADRVMSLLDILRDIAEVANNKCNFN